MHVTKAFWDIDLYEYDDERDADKCWVSAALWAFPPWPPIMRWWMDATAYGIWLGYEKWSVPGTRGWDVRTYNGVFYIESLLVEDEKERQDRQREMLVRAAEVIRDPFGYWNSFKPQLSQWINELLSVDVDRVHDSILVDHIYDCYDYTRRMATRIHYSVMSVIGGLTVIARDKLIEYAGITPDSPAFSTLVSGYDTELYRTNKGIVQLAAHALEFGLQPIFRDFCDDDVMHQLEKSPQGKKWLLEFNDFLTRYGLRPRIHGVYEPTWLEKPSLVIGDIKRTMDAGATYTPDSEREEKVRQREELVKEAVSKAPEAERDNFEKLIRCAQGWAYFNEDHPCYCDFPFFALTRRAAIACGKRLVKKGVLDEPEDAIFFYPVEIALALNPTANVARAREVLQRRKEECKRYLTSDHPVFLGDASKFVQAVRLDPIMAIGASSPIDSAEKLGVALVGGAGAPGVAEGTARVVKSIAEIAQVQPGDILVSPSTSPQWVTVFGIIKGVVTDLGGPMAHAVIVAREYSMPAVVGTLEATSKIKSGQRIRIDGNSLTVQILE